MDRTPRYICLYCLPRKNYYDGFGRLRAHLRAHHKIDKLSEEDSNRARSDGGYIHNRRHYFPGDTDFESWRAIGYGVQRNRRPNAVNDHTETSRGINITAAEFTGILGSVMMEMNRNISLGINNTLQGAAAMMSLASSTQSTPSDSRCIFPVPQTNNVLVTIRNPLDGSQSSRSRFISYVNSTNAYVPQSNVEFAEKSPKPSNSEVQEVQKIVQRNASEPKTDVSKKDDSVVQDEKSENTSEVQDDIPKSTSNMVVQATIDASVTAIHTSTSSGEEKRDEGTELCVDCDSDSLCNICGKLSEIRNSVSNEDDQSPEELVSPVVCEECTPTSPCSTCNLMQGQLDEELLGVLPKEQREKEKTLSELPKEQGSSSMEEPIEKVNDIEEEVTDKSVMNMSTDSQLLDEIALTEVMAMLDEEEAKAVIKGKKEEKTLNEAKAKFGEASDEEVKTDEAAKEEAKVNEAAKEETEIMDQPSIPEGQIEGPSKVNKEEKAVTAKRSKNESDQTRKRSKTNENRNKYRLVFPDFD